MKRPPAVRYLVPRLNFRFAFLCSFSAASRRLASSTARSTFPKLKALTDAAAGKGFLVMIFLLPLAPAKSILNKFVYEI